MARKSKQTAAAPEAELEQVDSGGLGIDEGIILGTFFLLVTAIVIVYFANQSYV